MNCFARLSCTALALALMLAMTVPTQLPVQAAGVWYVAPGGNDDNTCALPASPCATINGAVAKAQAGDTVYVAVGTYTSTAAAVANITKDLTLSGGWDAAFSTPGGRSTLDGQGQRLVLANSAVSLVERFIIRGGHGEYYAGGVGNSGGLTLVDSEVRQSTGFLAGGIHNSGWLTFTRSTLGNNHASLGGGLYNDHNAIVTFNDSAIIGNSGGFAGGGILNEHSAHATLNNTTVGGNSAQAEGGGIFVWACSSEPEWWSGSLTLNNVTISGNWAGWRGGGLSNNCGTVLIRNTLMAGNAAEEGPDCASTTSLLSSGYNLFGSLSGCSITLGTGDIVGADPLLGELVGLRPYYPLLAGSPAINAGNPAGCQGSAGPLPNDQRGVGRVGACDIGAYEYTVPGAAAAVMAWKGTPQVARLSTEFGSPLQATVLDNAGSPVSGAEVTFSAPTNGPSGTFADTGTHTTTATTNGAGIATAAGLTANGQTGSFAVTASAGSVAQPASFELGNWYLVHLPLLSDQIAFSTVGR